MERILGIYDFQVKAKGENKKGEDNFSLTPLIGKEKLLTRSERKLTGDWGVPCTPFDCSILIFFSNQPHN